MTRRRSDVRAAVDRAAAEAAADGLDGDGMVRVGDSFTSATINLVAELDASLVLLAWDGPKWANGLPVRQRHRRRRSDVTRSDDRRPPHRARGIASSSNSTDRVRRGRREDVELTADVVRHLREGTDVGLVVLCDDESMAELLEHDGDRDRDRERVTVVTDRGRARTT